MSTADDMAKYILAKEIIKEAKRINQLVGGKTIYFVMGGEDNAKKTVRRKHNS